MVDTSIALGGLSARFGLSPEQVEQLTKLVSVLATDAQAPTTVTDPVRAIDVHLADSLVALELIAVRESRQIVDIGAGTGFPGLALAVALTECEVTLVESQARKCAFIERMVAAAGIENVAIVCARVEEWPTGIGAYDVALARAVAPQPVVLEYAAPLLRLGGSLVDWRGRRDVGEEDAGLRAAQQLQLERLSIQHTRPFAGARDHHLHVFLKSGETPDRFPRRVGLARKKPLAGHR